MNIIANRAEDIGTFFEKRASIQNLFVPSDSWHLYLKLDFQKKYENAENVEDAKSFLRSVSRAAATVSQSIPKVEGHLLEIQGSLLHMMFSAETHDAESIFGICESLHFELDKVFSDRNRVLGWRMVADSGRTLLVSGDSIHGEESIVSLANSANRPAKYLYKQLGVPEESRDLKRNHAAIRNSENWTTKALGNLDGSRLIEESTVNFSEIRNAEPEIFQVTSLQVKQARERPLENSDSEKPQIDWGWVMRADLDGFTARVSSCYENDEELLQLASEFMKIMHEAANFATAHNTLLTQLPWAGDNFTAVANYPDKDSYEEAIGKELVGLSVDFEEAMAEHAKNAQCGGWSQCVAGGTLHGNSKGNVYVAIIQAEGRKFLVGVGKGVGKSLQAMSEISPDKDEIVIFEEDFSLIDSIYQADFESSKKENGETSSIFKTADIKSLESKRDDALTSAQSVSVTSKSFEPVSIQTRPYFKWQKERNC